MKKQRPSQTASLVAMMRALANDGFTTIPGFSEPFARDLLSPGWRAAYRFVSRGLRRAKPAQRAQSIARLDVTPMRMVAIDAELEAAIAAGCRQLVILGAGLDTRAFRLRSLASVDVFEVDHPATQAYKQRVTSALKPLSMSLKFVPVNFEHRELVAALERAGLRKDIPTVWIWEGVVMYLTEEATRDTLVDVARCSSPGSALLIHYHQSGRRAEGVEEFARRWLLKFASEPQIGERSPDTMQEWVRRAGFEIVSDTRPFEWARRLGAQPPDGQVGEITHLLVAKRVGSSD